MEEPLKSCVIHAKYTNAEDDKIVECARYLEAAPPFYQGNPKLEELARNSTPSLSKNASPPKLELKTLPAHLRYAYLGPESLFLVIISASLCELEEEKLL